MVSSVAQKAESIKTQIDKQLQNCKITITLHKKFRICGKQKKLLNRQSCKKIQKLKRSLIV